VAPRKNTSGARGKMYEYEIGRFWLELPDIIKINQLVRNKINIEGFQAWYAGLSIGERVALIDTLLEFGYQAGIDNRVWEEALATNEGAIREEIVQSLRSFHTEELGFHDWGGFQSWRAALSDVDRDALFVLSIYLFGTAEGRAYRNERKEWCNHWWHRNLSDPRVVEALLGDPRFYTTAMKDDDAFKDG
jgi:hypothetical protein